MNGVTRPCLPDWVPVEISRYLAHTVSQISIRELARSAACHPSTVMRQIHRVEQLREDPLMDGALQRLSELCDADTDPSAEISHYKEEDAVRSLTLLSYGGAVLAVGRDMPKAVILREVGSEVHKTVIERSLAEILALRDWVSCFSSGRVYRYRLSKDGRSALAQLTAKAEACHRSRMETTTQSGLAGQIAEFSQSDAIHAKRARYGQQDTPLQTLARLVDRDGNPFLSKEMVRAGERLREDFELAQIGQHVATERRVFEDNPRAAEHAPGPTNALSRDAFQRATTALCALGPGLSDIALRCCCHLEGLEVAERELGWSARSGKIVLRIALQQLHHHYESLPPQTQMIG